MQRTAVILGGPTASGKSALAMAIARALDGIVINADSMQVYRELPVLTAQPSAVDRAMVPHRLYGFLPVTEPCSAGRWVPLARAAIDAALDAGRLPIVVGGTGLYLRALTDGLAPVPEIPAVVREAARQRLADIGKAAFHAELGRRDPEMAARVRPADPQRMVRAWEVIEATGRSLADWQAESDGSPAAARTHFIKFVLSPERTQLYAACDARFAAMVARGALDEARQVMGHGDEPGLPGLKALGLRELVGHLRGATSLEAAIVAGQLATRRYAKRQVTWFRHQFGAARQIDGVGVGQFSESFLAELCNFIRISC
jgi:tRNA dimethylallyltransferase